MTLSQSDTNRAPFASNFTRSDRASLPLRSSRPAAVFSSIP
jgi:hypothetical protein